MGKPSVLLLLLLGSGLVQAQPLPPVVEGGGYRGGSLNERVERLERSNQVLMDLVARIEQLQREVRELRGDNEQLNYEIAGLKKRQRDLYLDLDRRLLTLEGNEEGGSPPPQAGLAPEPDEATGSEPPPPAAAPPSAPRRPATADERGVYSNAYNTLMAGAYDEAISQFRDFLAANPASELADNAQYWLAEAYYVTRDFQAARDAFQRVLDDYPGSAKIPDAALKLGFIAYELGLRDEARQALEAVVKQYPGSSAARLAENRLQRIRQERR